MKKVNKKKQKQPTKKKYGLPKYKYQNRKLKHPVDCDDTNEIVTTYDDYLATVHWRTKRIKIAEQNLFTCQICGKHIPNCFEIHHKTYERLGRELDSDLMCLCDECHKAEHKKIAQQRAVDKAKHDYETLPQRLRDTPNVKGKLDLIISVPKCYARFKKYIEMFADELEKSLDKDKNI